MPDAVGTNTQHQTPNTKHETRIDRWGSLIPHNLLALATLPGGAGATAAAASDAPSTQPPPSVYSGSLNYSSNCSCTLCVKRLSQRPQSPTLSHDPKPQPSLINSNPPAGAAMRERYYIALLLRAMRCPELSRVQTAACSTSNPESCHNPGP